MIRIQANLIDLHNRSIYPAEVRIQDGQIQQISRLEALPENAGFLLPGFVDAHVHIESSMLPPVEFARMAVVHGTVATVSDPHEIANVLGSSGVHYMLNEAEKSPLKFCFGAPSCVPATQFETAGAVIDTTAVESLLADSRIGYLSEMMNFPGVLFEDPVVMAKIQLAKQWGKPIDGHAPGLKGDDAKRYFEAGITTDHECFSYEEGLEKAKLGVRILIREGSAAKNFKALWPLINEFPEQIMFCSDDKHPDDLIKGHINELVKRALSNGCDLFDVLRAACIHPIQHYNLSVGQLREGDAADFIRISDLQSFQVLETYLDGKKVAENGTSLLPYQQAESPNHFHVKKKEPKDFQITFDSPLDLIRLIVAIDGEIVTDNITEFLFKDDDNVALTDPRRDVLKITVVNRYVPDAPPSVAFVKGFGLKKGAIASSVAHDSHNIVAVGVDDESICEAVNSIIKAKGGISATDGQGQTKRLSLPIAGLMSPENGYELAATYADIDSWTKEELGTTLSAPFMTLSFLALPVIPKLKITDLGLFDVEQFKFVNLEIG